jgi:hypothetical protein
MWQQWYSENRVAVLAKRRANTPRTPRVAQTPETAKLKARNRALHHKYGVSEADYTDMLIAQHGVCAACCRHEVAGRKKALSVDHSHTSGAIRGLLCSKCNAALGLVGDDVLVLRALIAYLESYGT